MPLNFQPVSSREPAGPSRCALPTPHLRLCRRHRRISGKAADVLSLTSEGWYVADSVTTSNRVRTASNQRRHGRRVVLGERRRRRRSPEGRINPLVWAEEVLLTRGGSGCASLCCVLVASRRSQTSSAAAVCCAAAGAGAGRGRRNTSEEEASNERKTSVFFMRCAGPPAGVLGRALIDT